MPDLALVSVDLPDTLAGWGRAVTALVLAGAAVAKWPRRHWAAVLAELGSRRVALPWWPVIAVELLVAVMLVLPPLAIGGAGAGLLLLGCFVGYLATVRGRCNCFGSYSPPAGPMVALDLGMALGLLPSLVGPGGPEWGPVVVVLAAAVAALGWGWRLLARGPGRRRADGAVTATFDRTSGEASATGGGAGGAGAASPPAVPRRVVGPVQLVGADGEAVVRENGLLVFVEPGCPPCEEIVLEWPHSAPGVDLVVISGPARAARWLTGIGAAAHLGPTALYDPVGELADRLVLRTTPCAVEIMPVVEAVSGGSAHGADGQSLGSKDGAGLAAVRAILAGRGAHQAG